MTKRICWKKGMRLTDEILRASDNCTSELVGISFALAASGRFGLIPMSRTFELSLSISKGLIDVESLNCLAVTKGGDLIDVNYDTKFTNSFETRVQIPEVNGDNELFLTINAIPNQWKDLNDGYEEPIYSYSLIPINSPIPANSLPIARIVDDYGWRVDDADFVPPCLFVASHPKYVELLHKFSSILTEIDAKAKDVKNSKGKEVIRIFLPLLQQILITVIKESDTMTPMGLLANVQKCVSAFTCACELVEELELENAEIFWNYVYAPYNYKNSYLKIREGLDLCFAIKEKVHKLDNAPKSSEVIEAPTIDESQLTKRCTNSRARVQIINNVPDAIVYYTVDGGEPTQNSKSGQFIQIESGFNNLRKKEPDKVVTVKVKAFLNGKSSTTNTYKVTLQKDIARWTGIEI